MRAVPEWIGKTPDSAVPDRVRLRVFERWLRRCHRCTMEIKTRDWICDHVIALINGGENRETNLSPLCGPCNKLKTAKDVADKSATYKTKRSHYLKRKPKGRPLPGTKASGLKRGFDGRVTRR